MAEKDEDQKPKESQAESPEVPSDDLVSEFDRFSRDDLDTSQEETANEPASQEEAGQKAADQEGGNQESTNQESTSPDKQETPESAPEASTDPANPGEISKIDEMLEAESPGATSELDDIQDDLSADNLIMDTLDLDDVLSGKEAPPLEEAPSKWVKIKKYLLWPVRKVVRYLNLFYIYIYNFVAFTYQKTVWYIKEGHKKHIEMAKGFLLLTKEKVLVVFHLFMGLSWAGRITTVLVVFLVGIIGYLIQLNMKGGGWLPSINVKPLHSLAMVADSITHFDEMEPLEEFDSPLRHPEHVVLLKKMVVNLKTPMGSRRRPMVALRLFVEVSSREAAIELKKREPEIVDLVQRTIEEFTFKDFRTISSKRRIKLALSKEISSVLNVGWAKKVMFETLITKP